MASPQTRGVAIVPSTDHLQRDEILQSMLSHLSEYEGKYEPVDVRELKNSVVKKVIDAADPNKPDEFNERAQLQGFLKAFQGTHAFASQFKILDKVTQDQIRAFQEKQEFEKTETWEKTHERGGFRLPELNPNVSEILNIGETSADAPSRIGQFFLNTFARIVKPLVLFSLKIKMDKAARKLEKNQTRKYIGGPKILEDEKEKKEMAVYSDLPFDNWGQSVKNTPKYTFVPTTVFGIQNLVKYAKANGFRVRCGGYRHSWSTSFSQDQEIFISLLPIVQVTMLPDPISIYPTGHSVPKTELNTIELLPLTPEVPEGKRWCRVGVAATNEDFRRWTISIAEDGGNGKWTLPADVILVEVTMGGVNGPICHGAGAEHATISDYVRKVEYVDANGVLRTVSDQKHLRAAAGCFGLLGIVTHLTLELDPMTYAVMKPLKTPIAQAIPPLQKNDIPLALRTEGFNTISDNDLKAWKEDFAKRAVNDYYSEWFWFTYQKRAWVNTWQTTTDPSKQEEYPSSEETFLQWLEGWIGQIVNETAFFRALPGAWQAQLLATLGMTALPPTNGEDKKPEYKTMLPNALHFRRGVQNMRVRDTEFQIPIPYLPNSQEPDWSVVQRAWWDAIKLVYDLSGKKGPKGFFKKVAQIFNRSPVGDKRRTPMRLTLELRIMGGSDLCMAPQAGNKYTASIEVLTVPDAQDDGEWQDFMQQLIGKWMSYRDASGNKLNIRPHWAKEWEGLKFGEAGKQIDAREYLRTVSYKDAIPDFKKTLAAIGSEHDWTLKDIQARFSNELWDKIVYS